jgi:hypothetical protein
VEGRTKARKIVLCLKADQAPGLRSLQAHIPSLGFKLTVDEAYAPFASEGHLPCTVRGEDSGVDLREEICALVMAAAMAQLAEALLVDPDKGLVLAPEALLKKAKALVADSF